MMCGITGIYSFKGEEDVRFGDSIIQMREALLHRGPDDRGVYISPDKRFYLAHTRLSIIDLTTSGHQPMSDQEGSIWISYNGEIYNYLQLRNELKAKDYGFESNSDTEVIINGYKEWGIDGLLKRLRGMFAFAIYDLSGRQARLILCRDRFGIKPLYYYLDDELLIFSSEVGAIVKSGIIPVQRNQKADIAFFIFGNIPAPLTTIKNVFSLAMGSYMLIEDGNKRLVRYYDLINSFTKAKIKNAEDIYNQLRSILDETVNLHLTSDAPLGVFLSGGIDSSALVALASKVRDIPITTLSIIFDEEEYSELPYQKMITKQYRTDHRQIKITEKDFYDELDNIFLAMDQPTVDGVNTYFVSKAAKQAGLKAVLSGTGADEVFCGYGSFKKIRLLKAINRLPKLFRSAFALTAGFNDRWRKLNYLQKDDHLALYLTLRGLFAPKDVERILDVSEKEIKEVMDNFELSTMNYELSTMNPIDWLSYMEINFYLQNQLLKDADFMSMYHSVETRVPYLDHILVDYIAAINSSLKIDRYIPKPLLVKPLKEMLPKKVVFRKKQGFTFPFDLWIKKQGKQLLNIAVSQGSINKKYAEDIWRKFEQGRLHWSRAWALIVMGRQ